MRLHTLPSLSWSLRTNLGIFFKGRKKGKKEEKARREGKKESLPRYRRMRLTRRQKAANTFENLLKMQEQWTSSYKYDFFAHKVYYASLLCNLETKNCIYRFVN